MLHMFRRLSPFILLIAVLIAVEPLLHNHPLESRTSSGSACAVCATGVGSLPTNVVVVGAPQVPHQAYAIVAAPVIAIDAPLPRSPRAPPAA